MRLLSVQISFFFFYFHSRRLMSTLPIKNDDDEDLHGLANYTVIFYTLDSASAWVKIINTFYSKKKCIESFMITATMIFLPSECTPTNNLSPNSLACKKINKTACMFFFNSSKKNVCIALFTGIQTMHSNKCSSLSAMYKKTWP